MARLDKMADNEVKCLHCTSRLLKGERHSIELYAEGVVVAPAKPNQLQSASALQTVPRLRRCIVIEHCHEALDVKLARGKFTEERHGSSCCQ